MEFLYKFSDRLKDVMYEKQVNIEELSNAINVKKSLIYKWLENKYIPIFDNLIKLVNYFCCSIDYLIGRSDFYRSITDNKISSFEERLKILMEKSGNSMYRICKSKKIAKYTFRLWLKGERLPKIDSLIKLADYFDCTIDYLVGRES